jgi:hypothetical protein
MATLANIVVPDNTPTNHTFYPAVRNNGANILFVNRESVTQAGNMSITLGLDLSSGKRLTNRGAIRFAHPFEVTQDSVVSVRDVARANTDLILPVGMTAAERLRFITMYNNLVALAVVKAYTSDLDPML